MTAGVLDHLIHLRLGNLCRIRAGHSRPTRMNLEHDAHGGLPVQPEYALQHIDDELHGREVVVEQNHLVPRRRLEFGLAGLFRETDTLVSLEITHVDLCDTRARVKPVDGQTPPGKST